MPKNRRPTKTAPQLRHLLSVAVAVGACALALTTATAAPATASNDYGSCPAYTSIGDGASSFATSSTTWAYNPANEEAYIAYDGQPCWQGSRLMCVGWVRYHSGGHWFWTHALYSPVSYQEQVPVLLSLYGVGYTVADHQWETFEACTWSYLGAVDSTWCDNGLAGATGLAIPEAIDAAKYRQLESWGFDSANDHCAKDGTAWPVPRIAGTNGTIWWTDGATWWWQTSEGQWHTR